MVFGVFFFQAEDGIRDRDVTGVQTCALPIYNRTSLIVDPLDGKIPLMTPAGRERRLAADHAAFAVPRPSPPAGPEDLSNFIRCITYGTPRLGGAAASYHNRSEEHTSELQSHH